MPYLHWERKCEVDGLAAMLKTVDAKPPASESNDAQLVRTYILDAHPIHIRRTLDQFQYHTLPDTTARDNDQTGLRYFRDEKLDQNRNLEPVTTMVDQLWMWVLPACGKSPETVITAFPQRCNRERAKIHKPKWPSLLLTIVSRCRDLSVQSAYELAEVIGTECSKIYLDSTSNREQPLQFLEIYTSSIGKIVCGFLSARTRVEMSAKFKSLGSRCIKMQNGISISNRILKI